MVGNVKYAEFRVGDLFEPILNTSRSLQKQEFGVYPLVCGSGVNNGRDGFTDNQDFVYEDEITISTRGSSGSTFFQKGLFVLNNNAMVLKAKFKKQNRVLIYMARCIGSLGYNGYQHYPTKSGIVNDIISLPVTASGQPDFEYMEDYIKTIEQKHIDKLETDLSARTENLLTVIGREDLIGDMDGLTSVVDAGFNFGVEYAEFRVGDLFDVVTGALLPKDLLVDEGRNDATLARASASSQNNGVTMHLPLDLEHKNYRIFENTVSVSFLGDVFYQEKSSFDMKVHGLQHNELTRNSGLYIAGVLRKLIDGRYSYGNQLSSSKLPELVLTLPVTASGEPDFDYMAQYIAHIELKYTHTLMQWTQGKESI